MRIQWFQHVSFEGLGSIEPWLLSRGHTLNCTRLYAGELPPSPENFDWLIVMGGPMNIDEHHKYPWLVAEKAAIRAALAADKRILGICLGAQLLAQALGGVVTRNAHTEIGWFPVELSAEARQSSLFAGFPERFEAYHWHGDSFSLPPGTVPIARSEACAQQAYAYGPCTVGLQFHLETTTDSAAALIENARDELIDAPYIQSAEAMLADPGRFQRLNGLMSQLLGRMESAWTGMPL